MNNMQHRKTQPSPQQQYAEILELAKKAFQWTPSRETSSNIRMAIQCSLAVMEALHPELCSRQLADIAGLHHYSVSALLATHENLINNDRSYIDCSSRLFQSLINKN